MWEDVGEEQRAGSELGLASKVCTLGATALELPHCPPRSLKPQCLPPMQESPRAPRGSLPAPKNPCLCRQQAAGFIASWS